MHRVIVRRIGAHLALALLCLVLSGCGGTSRASSKPEPAKAVFFRAKIFVMGLDYILKTSEFERTDSAFDKLADCLASDRADDWGDHAESREKLIELGSEVKVLLEQNPPNVTEARPRVDQMKKIVDKLPGDSREKPYLHGDWTNLKKL